MNDSCKIISKIFAKKRKPFMNKIIDPNQTAFLESGLISKNGLSCRKVLHVMKRSRARKGWVKVKIDFEKVINRIAWPFC